MKNKVRSQVDSREMTNRDDEFEHDNDGARETNNYKIIAISSRERRKGIGRSTRRE